MDFWSLTMRSKLPRLFFILILLLLLFSPTKCYGRQPPTSFCKCICFQNSTIIPLNSPQQSPSSDKSPDPSKIQNRKPFVSREEDDDGHDSAVHHRLTCADCTRAFCLDYNLPICKGAKDEDVFTTCFQRDSLKDETIVLLFVITTTGLLGWAVLKPWVKSLRNNDVLQHYAPVGNLNLAGLRREGQNSSRRTAETLPEYRDNGGGRAGAGNSRGSESIARQGGLNS